MATKIVVTIGNPGVTYPQHIPVTRTIVANTLASVQVIRTLVWNVKATAVGTSRFYGDPGVGNRYVGMEVTGGNLATFQNFESKVTLPTQVRRLYNPTGAVADVANNFNKCATDGKIPFQDMLPFSAAGISIGDFTSGTGPANTWMAALAALINGISPMPAYVSFEHEADTGKWSQAQGPSARSDIRTICNYLKSHCSNVAIVGTVFTMYTFKAIAGGGINRDWRIWDPNWNGTTTNFAGGVASGPTNPNSVDWQSVSCFDVFGSDVYNWWGNWTPAGDGGAGGSGTFTAYTALSNQLALCTNIVKKLSIYVNMPWAIGEFGDIAYSGSYRHGGSTGVPDFGAANHATFLKDLSDFFALNFIVMYCYWNSSGADPSLNWDYKSVAAGVTTLYDPNGWHEEAFNNVLALATTVAPVKQ